MLQQGCRAISMLTGWHKHTLGRCVLLPADQEGLAVLQQLRHLMKPVLPQITPIRSEAICSVILSLQNLKWSQICSAAWAVMQMHSRAGWEGHAQGGAQQYLFQLCAFRLNLLGRASVRP